MRGNLWDDPRVARLVDITDTSEAAVIGALYWLWATADQHTEDGILPGLSLRQIDRKTGVPGFGAALVEIGWLADGPDGVEITRFEEHNGTSAKRRCMEAQRKANARNVSAPDADRAPTDDGQIPPSCGAREREEKSNTSSSLRSEEDVRKRPPPRPEDVAEQVWTDWLALRKAKKAPVTPTVLNAARSEAGKAGMPLQAFLSVWCARGSQGLQADWLKPEEKARGSPTETPYQRAARERAEQFAPSIAAKPPRQRSEVFDVDARLLD